MVGVVGNDIDLFSFSIHVDIKRQIGNWCELYRQSGFYLIRALFFCLLTVLQVRDYLSGFI